MKTLKLVLVAAILSFAMISYAGIDPSTQTAKKVMKIELKKALKDPGLVNAMHAQLKISFLMVEQNGLYTATVRYNKVVYIIYGTRTAWVRFFLNTGRTSVGTTNWH
jgi:hypothetical protein